MNIIRFGIDVSHGKECKTKYKYDVELYRFGVKSQSIGICGIAFSIGSIAMFSLKNIQEILSFSDKGFDLIGYGFIYILMYAAICRMSRTL